MEGGWESVSNGAGMKGVCVGKDCGAAVLGERDSFGGEFAISISKEGERGEEPE